MAPFDTGPVIAKRVLGALHYSAEAQTRPIEAAELSGWCLFLIELRRVKFAWPVW